MNLKETYNRIAEDWHEDHQADDWWIEGTERFVSYLPPGASVLDVGCGAGAKSAFLAAKGLQVTGIDFSEAMIVIAKREVPAAAFLECDLGEIDRLEHRFAGVFAQAVLLHVPKAEMSSMMALLAERLEDGGHLYVAVKEKRQGSPEEEIKTERDYGYPYERFFSYYTPDEVESVVRQSGLRIVHSDVRPSGKTNWIQVIAKK